MDKEKLINSAKKIVVLSEGAIIEFDSKLDELIFQMNQRMLERDDILELIGGEKNISMMKDNHDNHIRFIRSILEEPDAETLVDTVLWVFRAYMSRGFNTNYWSAQINTWIHVMTEQLSAKTMAEVIVIYNWLSVNIAHFTIASDEKLEKSMHSIHE